MTHKFNYKIIFTIFIALIISWFFSQTIFLKGTPQIDPLFLTKLRVLPNLLVNRSKELFTSTFDKNKSTGDSLPKTEILVAKDNLQERSLAFEKIKKLPDSSLQFMSKGVYAKEDKKTNIVYIRITKDAEWEEKTVTIDGKLTKIMIPKTSLK